MVWHPLYCGHQGCFEAPPFGKSFHWCPGAETGYPGYVSDCTFWMKFKLQMTKYVTIGGWLGVGSIAKIYDVIVYFRIKVAGGTSILPKTIQAFLPPSVGTVLMVDLHGYDGFPALMALEASGLQLKQFQKRTAEPPTTRCLPHDRTFGQEKKNISTPLQSYVVSFVDFDVFRHVQRATASYAQPFA